MILVINNSFFVPFDPGGLCLEHCAGKKKKNKKTEGKNLKSGWFSPQEQRLNKRESVIKKNFTGNLGQLVLPSVQQGEGEQGRADEKQRTQRSRR